MVVSRRRAVARRSPTRSCARTASRCAGRRPARPRRDRAAELVAAGYERVDQVEDRGQFAIRGGLLDVYPATEERAVRVDLFDIEIESLRWFSTFTQRSLGEADVRRDRARRRARAPSTASWPRSPRSRTPRSRPDIAELLPVERFRELLDLVPRAHAGRRRRRGGRRAGAARPLGGRLRRLPRRGRAPPLRQARARSTPRSTSARAAAAVARSPATSRSSSAPRRPTSPRARCARPSPSSRSSCAPATRRSSRGRSAARASAPPTTSARLKASLERRHASGLVFAEASLRDGFVAPGLKLAAIPEHRLIHRRKASHAARRAAAAALLRSFTDLRTGDIVVHEDHGIARFAGFDTKTVAGVTRDYLNLEFQGDDKVFMPVDQLAKISRYVGADGAHPPLSKLGGTRWETIKARARRAAQELAGELLNLYAERTPPPRPRVPGGLRVAARVRGRLPLPRDARPARRDRARSRPTWRPSARWTA